MSFDYSDLVAIDGPVTAHSQLRRDMVRDLIYPELTQQSDVLNTLMDEHAKLSKIPCATITYRHRKYQMFSELGVEQPLHESLHVRMDQFLQNSNKLKSQTKTFNNFFTAVILKGKTVPNMMALVPESIGSAFYEYCTYYITSQVAFCRIPTTTLTVEQVEQFREQHAVVFKAIRTAKLNEITI